jgi:hypothetical protein
LDEAVDDPLIGGGSRAGGNAPVKMVRLSGVTAAAPSLCTARAAISVLAVGASAQAAHATVNSTRPAT